MFISSGEKLNIYLDDEDIKLLNENQEIEKDYIKIVKLELIKTEVCPKCNSDLFPNHEVNDNAKVGEDLRIYYDECFNCGCELLTTLKGSGF